MTDGGPRASERSAPGQSPCRADGAENYLFRLVADESFDWEVLEDPDGRILWVSPSCEPVTGHSPDEFLKHPGLLLAIVHPEDRARFESHRRECLQSDDGDESEFRIVRPDGGVRWIGHRCRPMNLPGGTFVGRRSSNREITEIKETERELLRLNRTLQALSHSSRALTRAGSESAFLGEVCRIIVEDCGHAMSWVGYAEWDEGRTVRPVAHAGTDEGYHDALDITWADTERGRGPTGTAIRTGKPVLCRNIPTDPLFAPWREEALKQGYASSFAFPLMADGRAFGALSIYSRDPDPLSGGDLALLGELADELSYGIAAIRLRKAHSAAEETLRHSEERIRSLFENMLDGFAYCELLVEDGQPLDFRFLAVNRAFETHTGLKDVAGKRVTEAIPGIRESNPELFETYHRVVSTGRPERFEIFLPPLEMWFSVSVYSSGKGFFTIVFENVTGRKRSSEALEAANREAVEERNRLRAVLEALPVGTAIVDEHGGNLQANRAFEDIWGGPRPPARTVEEYAAYKACWAETGEPVRPEEWASAIAVRDGRTVVGQRMKIERFDGRRVFVLNSAAPVLDAGGRITGSAVAVVDITAAREAEERLRELNETLEARVAERTAEAEKRAGQLRVLASELSQTEWRERQRLAGILHDHLQQILVGAKLSLEVLKGRVQEKELLSLAGRVDDLLDQSIAECRSLTTVLSPPVLQEAGLSGGLGWLCRRMEEQHGLRVELEVSDDFEEPADGGVKFFLFDAVRELLFNVVKHSGVRVARVSLGRRDGQIEVRVQDRGKGIERETAGEHGDPTAGFGLFSIRHRVDLIGGVTIIESAPGAGTSVTLRVPAGPVSAKTGPPSGAPSGAPAPETPGVKAVPGRVRVVIADDHRIFREGLVALLRAEGSIDVVGEAADGIEAVERAQTLRPDVIVMDVSMPRMNGIEATRRIAAAFPDVRVVGLSMHEDEAIARSMREAGAADFVTKGGPSDLLIGAIRAAFSSGGRA